MALDKNTDSEGCNYNKSEESSEISENVRALGRNRRVLRDIGSLVPALAVEGKPQTQISRPITRIFYPQLLEYAQVVAEKNSKVQLRKENGQTSMVPLFQSQENIIGKISIEPVSGKKVEHNGIKVELLGQIGDRRGQLSYAVSSYCLFGNK
ncbi:unnamed protein product [Fraxinus pennsylvanica]|uniref:Uncharacterized protein n=1 Tax=Fraxinus pennsylvanica TaxID=56036 RepID=A0AAD2E951_9LAMI|nr:unnamed protein product [Fraxinus pennsylvanica]